MPTREEIEEQIERMSREEKIKRLMEEVEEWDLDSLTEYALHHIEKNYRNMDDRNLNADYYMVFGEDEVDNIEEPDSDSSPEPQICQCELNNILNPYIGHDDDCPEYGHVQN